MATVLDLEASGELLKLDPCLDHRTLESRLWHLSPRLATWMGNVLPTLESSWGIEVTPQEQLDAFTKHFAAGEPLCFNRAFHPIRHVGGGVWMLKTPDLRVFGWFWRKNCFIGHCADWAERIKLSNMYHGYAGEVVRFRDALPLDDPKFIPGDDPDDVISDFYYP